MPLAALGLLATAVHVTLSLRTDRGRRWEVAALASAIAWLAAGAVLWGLSSSAMSVRATAPALAAFVLFFAVAWSAARGRFATSAWLLVPAVAASYAWVLDAL